MEWVHHQDLHNLPTEVVAKVEVVVVVECNILVEEHDGGDDDDEDEWGDATIVVPEPVLPDKNNKGSYAIRPHTLTLSRFCDLSVSHTWSTPTDGRS